MPSTLFPSTGKYVALEVQFYTRPSCDDFCSAVVAQLVLVDAFDLAECHATCWTHLTPSFCTYTNFRTIQWILSKCLQGKCVHICVQICRAHLPHYACSSLISMLYIYIYIYMYIYIYIYIYIDTYSIWYALHISHASIYFWSAT